MEELTPIFKELTQSPIAFLGGFFAGTFRLDLAEEPVKGWLEKEGVSATSKKSSDDDDRPQTIEIE